MEYERNFWVRSQLPTGLAIRRPKKTSPKAIPESQYENLKKMRDEGLDIKEISRLFGYSPYCISSAFKKIDELK